MSRNTPKHHGKIQQVLVRQTWFGMTKKKKASIFVLFLASGFGSIVNAFAKRSDCCLRTRILPLASSKKMNSWENEEFRAYSDGTTVDLKSAQVREVFSKILMKRGSQGLRFRRNSWKQSSPRMVCRCFCTQHISSSCRCQKTRLEFLFRQQTIHRLGDLILTDIRTFYL